MKSSSSEVRAKSYANLKKKRFSMKQDCNESNIKLTKKKKLREDDSSSMIRSARVRAEPVSKTKLSKVAVAFSKPQSDEEETEGSTILQLSYSKVHDKIMAKN